MKFLNYNSSYFNNCVGLFDENCPDYFAENERGDYISFLEGNPGDYFVGVNEGVVVSAFGVANISKTSRTRLSWIVVSSESKGGGVGIKMMNHSRQISLKQRALAIDIAASHLSAPFFAKFGAKELDQIQNGWGPGMHRVNMEIKL